MGFTRILFYRQPYCFSFGALVLLMTLIAWDANCQTTYPKKNHKSPVRKTQGAQLVNTLYRRDSLLHPIPITRSIFHEKIRNEQAAIDRADGRQDHKIIFLRDTSWSRALTYELMDRVNEMRTMIENMPANGRDEAADNQHKIRCLKALLDLLQAYHADPKPDARYYTNLVENMDSLLVAVNEHQENQFAHTHANLYTLDNSKDLLESRPDIRGFLYIWVGRQYPLQIARRLKEYAGQDFAGDILANAALIDPGLIFDYASSSDLALKKTVYDTDDSLVQCIVKIVALSKAPLRALPFVSDLYYARKTIGEIDSIASDQDAAFENLVRLEKENDTVGRMAYNADLHYRSLNFTRKLNELHEEYDTSRRYECVNGLSAPSLYYLLVNGIDEVYTSSFLGIFNRMLSRMAPGNGDQFLESLRYDHFRTFIRMCAGYNTLSSFLNTMSPAARNTLMSRFISGLEKGPDDDLEDAVEVADAFGSIKDADLLKFLKTRVKENYNASRAAGNKKGMAIYSILEKLVTDNPGDHETTSLRESTNLNLPPINKVSYKDLANDSGIVYQQIFFYGDKDGQDAYEAFQDSFRFNKNWIVGTFNDWIVVTSVKGKKIVIYANIPHKEPDDELAQDRLCRFLSDSGIHPTIMIHRGHSYHLASTLARLNPFVRIVILGSCGGYNNLASVLDRAPDAHIVSSKQTGVRAVNEPILKALDATLLAGNDVDWIAVWKTVETALEKKPDLLEHFSDYVPPYKNLGAIFIKAYRRLNPSAPVDE